MIDVHYFPAYFVCCEVIAAASALDLVHLKFSVSPFFLGKQNSQTTSFPAEDRYLLICDRKLSSSHGVKFLSARPVSLSRGTVAVFVFFE